MKFKQKISLSLVFALAVFLVMPTGFWPSVAAAQAPTQNSSLTESTISSVQSTSVIKVVTASPQSVIVVSSAVRAGCLASAATNQQSGGVLNLNQPANCFSLSVAPVVPSRVVVVSPRLISHLAVKVVTTAPIFTSAYAAGQTPISLPILPAAAAIFEIAVLVASRKILQKNNFVLSQASHSTLSLSQLQTLRC